MKPLNRKPQNKYKAASKFKHQAKRTKAANIAPPPMRGGYRL